MKIKRIAIIGAGASGLVALKESLEAGFEATCFERSTQLGGTWVFSDDPLGHSSVYKSACMNTSKFSSCFSDFAVPKDAPEFLHHSEVIKYLQSYADHFQLVKHIRFGTTVELVEYVDSKWRITTLPTNYQSDDFSIHEFDAVMIATGHHSVPEWPNYEGEEDFLGYIIHSHSYREPTTDDYDFQNKKVLVVGIGDSAVDIAVELSKFATVTLSTRSPAYIIPKHAFSNTLDHFLWNRFLIIFLPHRLATQLRNWFVSILAWVYSPPLKNSQRDILSPKANRYKIDNHKAHVTTSSEFWNKVSSGNIRIRSGFSRFTKYGAKFVDGVTECFDAVIFCTGYKIYFPFLQSSILNGTKEGEVALFSNVWNPDGPFSLALVGLVQPLGALFPISEMQARWIAQVWKGNCGLPSYEDMLEEVRRDVHRFHSRRIQQSNYTFQVESIPYMESLASHIGVVPDLWKNRRILKQLLLLPPYPSSYRLNGPGAKPEMASSILRSMYDLPSTY